MKTNPTDLFLIKKNKIYSKWTAEEDSILIESLKSLKIRNKWKTIGKLLNKKVFDCINRYKAINTAIKKGHWTHEEDEQVNKLIEVYGKNWAMISSIMKKRTGKQIRQRFLNFLDPKINKEKFTIDEDMKIYQLFKFFKTNWRYYIKYFPNRTADMIKGRYYSSIRFKENLLKIVEGLSGDQGENTAAIDEDMNCSHCDENNKLLKNNFNKKTQAANKGIKNNASTKIQNKDKENFEAKSEKACVSKQSPVQAEKLKLSAVSKITYLETQLNTTNSYIDSNEFINNSVDAEMESENDRNFSCIFNYDNNSYSNSNYISNKSDGNFSINNFNHNNNNNSNNKSTQNNYLICEQEFNKNEFPANTQTDFNEFESNIRFDNDEYGLFDGCNFENENFFDFNSESKFDFQV